MGYLRSVIFEVLVRWWWLAGCGRIALRLDTFFRPIFQISHRAEQIEFHFRDVELGVLQSNEAGTFVHAILVGHLRCHRLSVGATLVHLSDGGGQGILGELLLQVGDLFLRLYSRRLCHSARLPSSF